MDVKSREEIIEIQKQYNNSNHPLKILIVTQKLMRGFDAPILQVMYLDKMLKDQGLLQAVCRVNRPTKGKLNGLIVDYIGIAPQLKEALATYTESKGRGKPTIDVDEALKILEEKLAVARDLLHPVDWKNYKTEALKLLPECIEHILGLEDGRKRYCDVVLQMTKAYALCGAMTEALVYSEEVAFHQALRA